ncbi:hypothetical protein GCM10027321_12390 [Massilia terrae]|uniref:Uncharacterized protein n=1 Tax=Massilia terrae TaxID=1811224 RepID=A0ABT2D500_9BURK|nr:hypothetical protein [Massilia terrae]MCS0660470.1 hypothetical protein [Massilia terrae]
MPVTTYLALGVSADGALLVQRSFLDGGAVGTRPIYTCALAALDAQGGAFATEWLGAITLNLLPINFSHCDYIRPPAAQLKEIARDRLIPVSIEPCPTRPAHLRVHAPAAPDRLVIERDQPWPVLRQAPASLLLAALALSGPHQAAQRVGRALLNELAILHPDAIACWPQLAPRSA